MVDHCDLVGGAAGFACWEKALESAEAIPTTQEMPISQLANFMSPPTQRVSYRATDLRLIPCAKMSRIDQGSRDEASHATLVSFSSQGEMHSCAKIYDDKC